MGKPWGVGPGVLEQLFLGCPLSAGLRPRGGHSTLSCPNKLPFTDQLCFSDPQTASHSPSLASRGKLSRSRGSFMCVCACVFGCAGSSLPHMGFL